MQLNVVLYHLNTYGMYKSVKVHFRSTTELDKAQSKLSEKHVSLTDEEQLSLMDVEKP